MGKSYEIGDGLGQVSLARAVSWIGTGHANEDKALGAAPETKDAHPVEKKEKRTYRHKGK